jgi:MarR family 2-MHQ and catechol resistance regulon transcriptional repressor
MAQRKIRVPTLDLAAVRGLSEWLSLYQAYNSLFKVGELALLPLRITMPQLHLLAVLVYAGGVLPSTHIARQMVKEAQTITGLVDRMEAAGWVTRLGDPKDRRKTLVSLTNAGVKKFQESFPVANRMGAEIFAVLSDEELAELRAAVEKLRETALSRLGIHL